MVNDNENLLLGLYRESSSSETIEETSSRVVKKMRILEKTFIVYEDKLDHAFVWKVFDSEKELSREEIVKLYAESNLRRQMIGRLKGK